jgi:hypothetical protein
MAGRWRPIAFTDEAEFLTAAAALGVPLLPEGFEDDADWGSVRSGLFGVYSYPHGSYTEPDPGTDCYVPGECGSSESAVTGHWSTFSPTISAFRSSADPGNSGTGSNNR